MHRTEEGVNQMSVFCSNCGRELPDGSVFCDNCGSKIAVYYEPVQKQSSPVQQQKPIQQTVPVQKPAKGTSKEQKKKGSCLGTLLKILISLALIGALAFGVLYFLEKIYHRIPPMPIPGEPGSVQGGGSSGSGSDISGPSGSSSGGGDVSQGVLTPDGDPWFDEFLFYEDYVYDNGIPDGATLQTAGYVNGQWKYCITFNRTLVGRERIDEIGLAEVELSEDKATVILHPQYIRYGSDVSPETEAEVGYPIFTGTWTDEYIDVMGNDIALGLGPFYSYDGKDYVLGNIVIRDSGVFGDLLLVRP